MPVRTRIGRALHELFALAVLGGLIVASAWLAQQGFRWSGPYPLAAGISIAFALIFVRPIRARVDAVTDRIEEIAPSVVYWPALFALGFAINLVDFPTGGPLDAVFTVGFSAMTTWLLVAIARAYVGKYVHDGAAEV